MDPKKITPFEIKTTQITQAAIYLWVSLLAVLPVFVSSENHPLAYLIAILIMMVVFLSFFLCSFHYLKKDQDDV